MTSEAIQKRLLQEQHFDNDYESLIIIAAPLGNASLNSAVWVMSRAHVDAGAAYQKLSIAFAILFGFALLSGLGLAFILQRWLNHVAKLEAVISGAPVDALPFLAETGQQELDRIVSAINHLSAKLKLAQEETHRLNQHLIKTERMTVLGHMAAEVAHDIRNPIAAMRLRIENALAKSDEHYKAALEFTLQEIRRLDDLLEKLLAVTHLSEIKRAHVPLRPWLEQRLDMLREGTKRKAIALNGVAPDGEWNFGESSMTRALDNLLLNSLQHTPEGGWINVTIQVQAQICRIIVEDSGAGISSDQSEHVFESMMTTRPEGLGLGLAIAREIVKAHDGTLKAVRGAYGARFEMELPWRVS